MKISANQLRWFRMRRSGLVEPFDSLHETARRLIGVQAQLLPAASLAFCNRTEGLAAGDVDAARLEKRSLVRLWGQRNTLHIYDTKDWPFLHAALGERRSIMHDRLEKSGLAGEFRRLVRRTEKKLERGAVLTHSDIRSKRLEGEQDKWVVSYVVFMELVREGVVCHGAGEGNASRFVHRKHWLPKLKWKPPKEAAAMAELATRYLATYGPASAKDFAFWYGAGVTKAKSWIAAAGETIAEVSLADETLLCRADDLEELAGKPPPPSRWPVRLLYRFDPLLLATKNKASLIDAAHYKKVWLPSAHVAAVLLVAGRIAGTWRYDRKSKGLHVRVSPFAKLSVASRRAASREAERIAASLAMPLAAFDIG